MALGYLGKTLAAAAFGALSLGVATPATAAQTSRLEQAVVTEECTACSDYSTFEVPAPKLKLGTSTIIKRNYEGEILSRVEIGITRKAEQVSRILKTQGEPQLTRDKTASFVIGPGESVEIWAPFGKRKGKPGTILSRFTDGKNPVPAVNEIAAFDHKANGRTYAVIGFDELLDQDLDQANVRYQSELYIPGKKGPMGEPYCASTTFDLIVSKRGTVITEEKIIERVVERRVEVPVVEERVREVHHFHELGPQKKPGKCNDDVDNDGDGFIDFQKEGDISMMLGKHTYWGRDDNGNGRLDRSDLFRDPGCNGPNDGEKWNKGKTKKLKKWLIGYEQAPKVKIQREKPVKHVSALRKEVRLIGGISNDQYTFEQPDLGVKNGETFDAVFTGLQAQKLSPKTKLEGTLMVTAGSEALDSYGIAQKGETAFGFAASVDKKILGPLSIRGEAEYVTHNTYEGVLGRQIETSDQNNMMVGACGGFTFGEFSGNGWLSLQGCATAQSIIEEYEAGPRSWQHFTTESHYDYTPSIRLEAHVEGKTGLFLDVEGRYGLGSETMYTNVDKLLLNNESNFNNFTVEFGKRWRNGWFAGAQLKHSWTEDTFIPDPTIQLEDAMRDALHQVGTHSNNRLGAFVGKGWK